MNAELIYFSKNIYKTKIYNITNGKTKYDKFSF